MRMIWRRVGEGGVKSGKKGLGGSSEDLAPHKPRGSCAMEGGVGGGAGVPRRVRAVAIGGDRGCRCVHRRLEPERR